MNDTPADLIAAYDAKAEAIGRHRTLTDMAFSIAMHDVAADAFAERPPTPQGAGTADPTTRRTP